MYLVTNTIIIGMRVNLLLKYAIASSDLISKYYWLSYFGSFNYTSNSGSPEQYVILPLSTNDRNGTMIYGPDAFKL